ncbi:histidine phosphatase superfamily [Syncephalastrum racemosum]|uniref:Histidine phosphatase superfamily n=1 Tax=Syncephalastrum racemosum TaxID=13706 RepID=A0A1X2HHQ2_SYNRA|nr:histidine phosphatase superfamily [Syncephalastrum racemosum]
MVTAALPKLEDSHHPEDLELTLLQVVHRHGERTPVRKRLVQLFPAVWNVCDANGHMFATIMSLSQDLKDVVPLQRLVETQAKDKTRTTIAPGACYYGQLTNIGRTNMAKLGARLREIYVDKLHFLPEVFEDKTIYIRSTDYTRTQESVQQLVASGLYPPNHRPENFTLKIRTRDPRVDNLFPNPNCYRLRQLAKDFHKQVSEMCADQFKSLSKRLNKYVDEVSLESHPSANGILDTLASAKAHGFDLPSDIDEETLRDLEDVVVKEWFYGTQSSQEVRRLGLGAIMGDIRDRMVQRADGSDKNTDDHEHKLAIYSGHDTTVAPLLIILGGFNNRWPPFCSAILFELYKGKSKSWNPLKKTEHYVRVRYNEKVLELPGCAGQGEHYDGDKSLCTLEAFKKIVKEQIPDDWEDECKAV